MFCLLYLALTIYGANAQIVSASRVLRSWPNAKGNIVIPDTVTEIDNIAFIDCSSLKNFKWPKSLKRVGYMAFSYCSSLKKLALPNSITYVYANSFTNCSRLKSIIIGENTGTVLKTTIVFKNSTSLDLTWKTKWK